MESATVEVDGQYRALREEAGFLERERAHLTVAGPEAAEYLQGQLTNDVEALAPGAGCYAALLDRKGRMQGDMRVLRVAADEIWLDLEPLALEAVAKHLRTYRVGRQVEVAGAERALFSVIGPAAERAAGCAPFGPEDSHREAAVGGISTRAVATDVGVDLLCEPGDVEALREALAASGAEPVGEAAAEIVSIESGRPRFGREMTTATMPQEAGINERAVSFSKGCYIGQETVARLHYKGKPNRLLRGLRLDRIAAAGAAITLEGRALGTLGSVALSPARGPIGLAIVRREAEPGARVGIGDDASAEVVELPF